MNNIYHFLEWGWWCKEDIWVRNFEIFLVVLVGYISFCSFFPINVLKSSAKLGLPEFIFLPLLIHNLMNAIPKSFIVLLSSKYLLKWVCLLTFNTVNPAYTTTSYKTTTRLRRPMLSPPMRIPIQSLLYKTTTCLTRPATTFFCPPNEKNLSKTTTA